MRWISRDRPFLEASSSLVAIRLVSALLARATGSAARRLPWRRGVLRRLLILLILLMTNGSSDVGSNRGKAKVKIVRKAGDVVSVGSAGRSSLRL